MSKYLEMRLEELKKRVEVQFRFEQGEKIQYRKVGTSEWKEAYWSDWKWDQYDYRIRPADVEVEIPLVCYMDTNGLVHWVDASWCIIPKNWRPIKRFVTRNKVRCAVI